jgi:uncharacterized protein (TIGR02594 family)
MVDNKVNNIMLPTGETIAIPQWASESTLQQVAAYMSATNKVDQQFVKLVNNMGGGLSELQKTISGLVNSVERDNTNDQEQQRASRKFSDSVVGAARAVDRASRFFGDAERPLSGLKEAASSVWSSLRNSSVGTTWMNGMLGNASSSIRALGIGIDVAADAVLAYAGWNAAKYEQFAQAQASAINFGIMLNGGAAAYDDLRKTAIGGGITYTRLLEVTNQYSDAMLGLGDTMGTGSQRFATMFEQLNQAADAYGDLGMSSSDMAEAYAEYLSYARRTGQLNRNMNRSAEDLNNSFINLQLESSAIASLTALSATEARRRMTQSLTLAGQAGLFNLREAGLPGQADVATAIVQNLGLVAPDSPMLDTLLNAYQTALQQFGSADRIGQFDLDAILQQQNPGMINAISEVLGSDFLTGLEDLTKSGTASAESVRDYLFNAMNNADVTARYSANAAADSVGGMVNSLQGQIIELRRNYGNLGNASAVTAAINRVRSNIGAAGSVTADLNDMTTRFLELQETITMDMATISTSFDILRQGMERVQPIFERLLGEISGEENVNDFGGIDTRSIGDITGEFATNAPAGGTGVPSPPAGSGTSTPPPGAFSIGRRDNASTGTIGTTPSELVNLASTQLGLNETDQNAALQEYLRNGGVNIDPAVTAWCAAFVNATLAQRGIEGTGSNLARSFLNWGEAVEEENLQVGDLVVFSRGAPGSGFGHVGFFQGYDENGNFRVLGGNQGGRAHGGGAVTISSYGRDRLLGFRRAPGTPQRDNRSMSDVTGEFVTEETTTPAATPSRPAGEITRPDGVPANFVPVPFNGYTIFVSPDYVRGNDGNYRQFSNETAEAEARRQNSIVPTREMVDAVLAAADVRLAMPTQNIGQTGGTGDSALHTRRVQEQMQREGVEAGELVAGHMKNVVQGVNAARGAEYGGLRENGSIIQPYGQAHNRSYADYSQGLRLVHQRALDPNGNVINVNDISRRRFGGNVLANLPYLVGDQLGLNTAELFVPETAGRIVNNTDLQNIISSTLTDVQQNVNIPNIDLSSMISSKEETLRAAEELRNALRTMLRNARMRMEEDISNSR